VTLSAAMAFKPAFWVIASYVSAGRRR